MPQTKTYKIINVPGHEVDCECRLCLQENENCRRVFREHVQKRPDGPQASQRFRAGFIQGWKAARREAVK